MANSTSYTASTSHDRVCLCQACQVSPRASTSAEVLSLLPNLKSNLTLSQGESEELVVKSRQLSLKDECEIDTDTDTTDAVPPETVDDTCEDETSSACEVAELAGYLEDQLYLPRESVSADAALMADLMYT